MMTVGLLRPHPTPLVARPILRTASVRVKHVARGRCQRARPVFRAASVDAVERKRREKDALYEALSNAEAWLVSTQEKVPVTSLWNASEKCVLVFARSMGCVFCQEYARQLKRDVLPKLEGTGVQLYLVSIGTAERGREFSEVTGFPQSQLIADPENVLYDAVGFFRNIQRTFFDIRTPLSIFGRALRKDRGADLVEATQKWKPWIPPRSDQALQQGGILIFDGEQCTFQYLDQATGNHMDLEELLALVLKE